MLLLAVRLVTPRVQDFADPLVLPAVQAEARKQQRSYRVADQRVEREERAHGQLGGLIWYTGKRVRMTRHWRS